MAKTENSKMTVGKLREYLQSTKGTRAPIQHRLKEEDNYTQNMYFKALCMVQGYDPDETEEQTLFLQRLLAGSDTEYDLLTYMRQGREMTSEEYEELVDHLTKKDLEYTFALDVLLIAGLGSGSDEMIQFVAELCESLRINEYEMKFLADIGAAVLRQDYPGCVMLDCNRPEAVPSGVWDVYLICAKDEVYFVNTENQWCLAAQSPKRVNLAQYGKIETCMLPSSVHGKPYEIPSILITGATACLYHLEICLDTAIFFKGFDNIDFVNCKFHTDKTKTFGDQKAVSICFSDCKKVKIRNCVFQNFHGRTIYITDTLEVMIENSEFLDCKMEYNHFLAHWNELGGVIHGDCEKNLLELSGCHFADCGGRKNNDVCWCSSVISNCQTRITNCVFDRCWHYSYEPYFTRGYEQDSSNPQRCLFRHIISESGNELTDSEELGLHE